MFWMHERMVLLTRLQFYLVERLQFCCRLRLMLRSVLSLGQSVLVRGMIVDIFF